MSTVTIRPAFPDDAAALERLAQLDSAVVPAGALLIAEVDGEVAAALAIGDDSAIADPFRPTAALVALLAQRARQLRGPVRRRRVLGQLSAARNSLAARTFKRA